MLGGGGVFLKLQLVGSPLAFTGHWDVVEVRVGRVVSSDVDETILPAAAISMGDWSSRTMLFLCGTRYSFPTDLADFCGHFWHVDTKNAGVGVLGRLAASAVRIGRSLRLEHVSSSFAAGLTTFFPP